MPELANLLLDLLAAEHQDASASSTPDRPQDLEEILDRLDTVWVESEERSIVDPHAIAEVLKIHPSIAAVEVVPSARSPLEKDEDMFLVAQVVLVEEHELPADDVLLTFLASRLPDHVLPTAFVSVDHLRKHRTSSSLAFPGRLEGEAVLRVKKSDRCPWWETYREDQWAAVWLALEDHATEQVEAAERHELPVPGRRGVYAPPELRRPLSASALVVQTRREVRAGALEAPRCNRGLFETVRRIFDGVLLREYLEVLPEVEWVRLQKRLFIRAARFLGSRAGFEEVEHLVQKVIVQACTGERPWPRKGHDLVPLYPFFVWAMRSELSNQATRKSAGQPTFGGADDLLRSSRIGLEHPSVAPSAGEVLVRNLVETMLDTLEGAHREAIERLLQRDTAWEIHERLGVPLATVHRWIRDFRHELRAALSAHPPVEKKKEL